MLSQNAMLNNPYFVGCLGNFVVVYRNFTINIIESPLNLILNEEMNDFGLGLNEQHQNELCNYMRFARSLRGQRLRAVESCFQDVKFSRLFEETFTLDEVTSILNELSAVVKAEVESELINMAHTNAVLLQQMLCQAEKWHLKLQVDTAHLENRDLLDKVKNFEEKQLTERKEKHGQGSPTKYRLEPLNDVGGAALLQQEIDRLQEDNMKLRDRLKNIESQASTLLHDRSALSEDLRTTRDELAATHSQNDDEFQTEMSHLNEQLTQAKQALSGLQLSTTRQEDLEKHLTQVGQQLLVAREQLEMAEKELEKKVGQTTAYMNLKKMLHQKNELIKTLRKKLAKYEPDVANDADD